MKKLLFLGTMIILFTLTFFSDIFASSTIYSINANTNSCIKIVLDGNNFQPKEANGTVILPIIYKNITYVQLQATCDKTGIKFDTKTNIIALTFSKNTSNSTVNTNNNSSTQLNTNSIKSGNHSIKASINNSLKITINGKIFQPKDAKGTVISPIIYKNKVYIPLQSICDLIGIKINTNGKTNTITLTMPNTTPNSTVKTNNTTTQSPSSKSTDTSSKSTTPDYLSLQIKNTDSITLTKIQIEDAITLNIKVNRTKLPSNVSNFTKISACAEGSDYPSPEFVSSYFKGQMVHKSGISVYDDSKGREEGANYDENGNGSYYIISFYDNDINLLGYIIIKFEDKKPVRTIADYSSYQIKSSDSLTLSKIKDIINIKVDRTKLPSNVSNFTKISVVEVPDNSLSEINWNIQYLVDGKGRIFDYDDINGFNSGNYSYLIVSFCNNDSHLLGYIVIKGL